jgi:hypothetical protein
MFNNDKENIKRKEDARRAILGTTLRSNFYFA